MTSNFFFGLLDITARGVMLWPKPPNNPTWSVSHVDHVTHHVLHAFVFLYFNGHTLSDVDVCCVPLYDPFVLSAAGRLPTAGS